MILPPEAGPLLAAFAPLFTQPTYHRFVTLTVAALLTPGRRTVANLVRTLGRLAPGHRTTYQRVLSAARWSGEHRSGWPNGASISTPRQPAACAATMSLHRSPIRNAADRSRSHFSAAASSRPGFGLRQAHLSAVSW